MVSVCYRTSLTSLNSWNQVNESYLLIVLRVVFVESFCCNTKKSLQIYTVYLGNKLLFSTIVKSWYNNILFLCDSVIFKWVSRTLWWTESSVVCFLKSNINIKIHLAKNEISRESSPRDMHNRPKTKTFFPALKNINVWNCKQKCNWIKIKRTVHFWSICTTNQQYCCLLRAQQNWFDHRYKKKCNINTFFPIC